MRTLNYGIAAGLLASLCACSNFMGGSGSSSPQSAALARPPVAPDMVRQVQSKLRDDGYYKQGPVDGVWGSATEASVRSYQHDHNLATNGQLDVPTLQALNLASRSTADTAANNSPPRQPDYNQPARADNTAPAPQR